MWYLHILLLIYSLSGICAKYASNAEFMSLEFSLLYGAIIIVLFIYAIGWQQVIKRMDLSIAFANKSITVIWGILWGLLFFGEELILSKIVGALLVMIGCVLYSFSYNKIN
jgi:drug/metabolite transporter (DMT)-like permease